VVLQLYIRKRQQKQLEERKEDDVETDNLPVSEIHRFCRNLNFIAVFIKHATDF
jgi:hypothetical protein